MGPYRRLGGPPRNWAGPYHNLGGGLVFNEIIINEDDDEITLEFNEPMDPDHVPNPEDFTVIVNGDPVDVIEVIINPDGTVTLVLDADIDDDDVIEVGYTPGDGEVLTTEGGDPVSPFPPSSGGEPLPPAVPQGGASYVWEDENVFMVVTGGGSIPIDVGASQIQPSQILWYVNGVLFGTAQDVSLNPYGFVITLDGTPGPGDLTIVYNPGPAPYFVFTTQGEQVPSFESPIIETVDPPLGELISRITVNLTPARMSRFQDIYNYLNSTGALGELDALYLPAEMANEADSKLNWMGDYSNATFMGIGGEVATGGVPDPDFTPTLPDIPGQHPSFVLGQGWFQPSLLSGPNKTGRTMGLIMSNWVPQDNSINAGASPRSGDFSCGGHLVRDVTPGVSDNQPVFLTEYNTGGSFPKGRVSVQLRNVGATSPGINSATIPGGSTAIFNAGNQNNNWVEGFLATTNIRNAALTQSTATVWNRAAAAAFGDTVTSFASLGPTTTTDRFVPAGGITKPAGVGGFPIFQRSSGTTNAYPIGSSNGMAGTIRGFFVGGGMTEAQLRSVANAMQGQLS